MKIKLQLLVVALLATLLVGCGNNGSNDNNATPSPSPTQTATPTQTTTPTTTPSATPTETAGNNGNQPDAVTSASIVDTEEAFEKALASDGTWIIAALKDMTFDKDLVLDGEFKNERGEVQRKIALYTQDDNRVVTNRFTLTAPKLTIKSPNASIQHGMFKGDLYVETKDFQLVDTKVEGNIYFASEEAKSGFKMDAESSVSGKQEVKK